MLKQAEFDQALNTAGIVPVINVTRVEQAVPLVQTLHDAGFTAFEFTLRNEAGLPALEAACKQFPDFLVGAGSVLDATQYDAAVSAGAKFVVSPGATPALIEHVKRCQVPWLPGAATASEIMRLKEAGFHYVKFFPAETLGGVAALKAISAPLQGVRFCPTGGVSPQNLKAYLSLECVACVGGSWMLPAEALQQNDWQTLGDLARQALALVRRDAY